MERQGLSVRDFCAIGIFVAVISALAQISIQTTVPMTLQTFAVPLAGVVLGWRRGALAALVYVLLGALGAPVFSGFTGGVGIVLGPTGGFLLSFPVMALIAGMGAEKGGKARMALGLAVGAIVNYLCGMFFFCFVMSSSMWTAFTYCVLPFLAVDAVKLAMAGLLGVRIRNALTGSRLLA